MDGLVKQDQRFRLAKLQVLIADNDVRSAQLIKTILMAFGIRRIDLVYNSNEVLNALRTRRVDLLVTEQVLEPLSGQELVRTIRNAKNDKLLRFDMPILMLTAHAAQPQVVKARDAGITEFVAKPFSARTISSRLIEIIDNPRVFVETTTYSGPSRRRRATPPEGVTERRIPREERIRMGANAPKVVITRANRSILEMINSVGASDIITEEVITVAQTELMKSEGDFVAWVKDDIVKLEAAYADLAKSPTDNAARGRLLNVAYTIKSQAGIFGYELGTVVADLLITYVTEHPVLSENTMLVVRKHIDTINVIFTQKVKDSRGDIGVALIDSLTKLTTKFS